MSVVSKAYCRTFQQTFRVGMCALDWSEPELLEGAGAVLELPKLIKSKDISKVLVVTDKTLMDIHLLDGLFAKLDEVRIDYVVYDGTQVNPSIENIEEARAMYLRENCEGIIAFGGGSPMDCAKATGARLARPKKSVSQLRGLCKVLRPIPPLFAVPTTAGTGSEATLAAVVTDMRTHEKYAQNDPFLRPKYAVLDAALTTGLPKHITSTTGMDALTHAVEAYIGKENFKITERYAINATKMIFKNLKKAYDDGSDLEARGEMLKASFYAGMAFTRAYVGYIHAIAHNLGGLYGVPHGLANAVIMPYVLEYYGTTAHARLADLADAANIMPDGTTAQKAEAFIQAIKDMNESMNIPTSFDCIKEEDIPTIVKRALKEGNPLYPVPKIMDEADCEAVVRRIMGNNAVEKESIEEASEKVTV